MKLWNSYALHNTGYILFATPLEAHPKANHLGINHICVNKMDCHFGYLKKDCLWILSLEEERSPQPDYHMGYWTDVIAVSQDAPLPETPTTLYLANHFRSN